jgi:hypothetical protein
MAVFFAELKRKPKRDSGFSVDVFLKTLHYKRHEDIEHHRAALLKVGLPEFPAAAAAS